MDPLSHVEVVAITCALESAIQEEEPRYGDFAPLIRFAQVGKETYGQWPEPSPTPPQRDAPPLDDLVEIRFSREKGGGQCLGWIDPDTGAPMPAPYEEPGGVQVDDDGEHGLTDLRLQGPEPCDLTLVLARVVLGAYPASLTSGGRVEGRAERYVDVRAVPAP